MPPPQTTEAAGRAGRFEGGARCRAAAEPQRPCIWKSPLFCTVSSHEPAGPARTGLARIERAATAASTSLVMAVAPSRVGLGSAPGFGKCVFSTCEARVPEARKNEGERLHMPVIF